MTTAEDSASPSSPVCAAAAGSDAYQHRAEPAELIEFLNLLLEAELAGTRVARESLPHCGTVAECALLEDVFADESRWCAMPSAAIARRGGQPSQTVGDFHQRAMAIAALDERLRFLSRGQGWVAKRLGEMVPRLGDGELRQALVAVRENHVANIARVNDFLPAVP